MQVRLLVSHRWNGPAEKESSLPAKRLSRTGRIEGQHSGKQGRGQESAKGGCAPQLQSLPHTKMKFDVDSTTFATNQII